MEWRQRKDELTMTTFHLWQRNRVQYFGRNESAGTFNFTSRIASSICTVMITKRVKLDAVMFKSRCSRTAVSYRFYTRDALLLNCVRFLRLANSSPVIQRYPASWSHSVRERPGKTSGKMSCATSAQFPGNCRAVANTLPPNIRADDLRDNPQDGAQRSWRVRVAVRIAAMQHPAKHPASSRFCHHVLNHDSPTL